MKRKLFLFLGIFVSVLLISALAYYIYIESKTYDLEYLEILNKNTLEEDSKASNDSIALIACRVDGVRLIDNIYFKEV